jgi:hypothetical protein
LSKAAATVREKAVAAVEKELPRDPQRHPGKARTAAAVPSSALAVPASLHASLMARLDRLGPAKEIAQIEAVIGREFLTLCLLRSRANRKTNFNQRSIVHDEGRSLMRSNRDRSTAAAVIGYACTKFQNTLF